MTDTRYTDAALAARDAETWNAAIEAAAHIMEREGHSLCVEIRALKKEPPMQCAECTCDNPPEGCNWIASGKETPNAH